MSYPTRGTWVEIGMTPGLILAPGRTPHGVRELKSFLSVIVIKSVLSYPTRGTWVEIPLAPSGYKSALSYPTRGTWVEISLIQAISSFTRSYPTRGTWVEIFIGIPPIPPQHVVPHTGYVSWNEREVGHSCINGVVPHTGYVSWNFRAFNGFCDWIRSYPTRGTWVEIIYPFWIYHTVSSYPTRGTWVEIEKIKVNSYIVTSYPTRGTWVEIPRMEIERKEL